jgi:hypothetical protein
MDQQDNSWPFPTSSRTPQPTKAPEGTTEPVVPEPEDDD